MARRTGWRVSHFDGWYYMMSRDVEGRWLDLRQRETGVSQPIV
jgi:hypothetical protein